MYKAKEEKIKDHLLKYGKWYKKRWSRVAFPNASLVEISVLELDSLLSRGHGRHEAEWH